MRGQIRSNLELVTFEIDSKTYHAAAVPDCPQWYASTCGFIISDICSQTKVLKSWITHRGKLQVGYYYNDKKLTKKLHVHRLVASTFFSDAGLDANGRERNDVNHVDGDTCNNRVTNLEFCSRSENLEHHYKVLEASDHKHITERNRRPRMGNTSATEVARKALLLSSTAKAA